MPAQNGFRLHNENHITKLFRRHLFDVFELLGQKGKNDLIISVGANNTLIMPLQNGKLSP